MVHVSRPRLSPQIPDQEFGDMWTALRLPVLAQEAAAERLANLKDDEAHCLELLKKVRIMQGVTRCSCAGQGV